MKLFELFSKINEGPYDPHTFKAVFMAGGPGSGKSFFAKRLIQSTGLRLIDLDEYYIHLKKTQDLRGFELQAKAKRLRYSKINLTLGGNLGMLIDGTGRNFKRISAVNEKLKSLGYETAMVFVNTDLDTAIARNKNRDRVVPLGWLARAHKSVRDNIGKFQMTFGNKLFIIDNTDIDSSEEQYDMIWKRLQQFLNSPIKGN